MTTDVISDRPTERAAPRSCDQRQTSGPTAMPEDTIRAVPQSLAASVSVRRNLGRPRMVNYVTLLPGPLVLTLIRTLILNPSARAM